MVALVRVWDDLPGAERVLIGGRALTLRRSPAGGPAPPPCDEHLAAGPGETSTALLACADVIVSGEGEPARLLAAYPGCLVAAVAAGRACLVAVGDAEARLDPVLGGTCAPADAALYASAVHAWLVAGGSFGAVTRLTLLRGNAITMVRVRHRPAARPEDRRAVP
ncbi:hypothetical protein [Actinomadura chokoriensis]|uniref:Uncharacterized protein n=1 Tax=Actinomadura chokoriensis TaxID=454156 RepID=A0ABV4QYK2_9ACTN